MSGIKKLRAGLLSCVCAAALAVPANAEVIPIEKDKLWAIAPETETLSAAININDENAMFPARRELLGGQAEIMYQADSFLEVGTTELQQEWKDFAQNIYKFPVIRMGGAETESTSLIRNIGPTAQRKASEFSGGDPMVDYDSGRPPARLGPLEFVKWAKSINPDFAYLVNVSMRYASPEENAQYAAFLTHRPGESEWGALRAAYGMPEPVKVFAFELGNEIDCNIPGYRAGEGEIWGFNQKILDWYAETAAKHIAAIRELCPNAVFMGCGKTAPWGDGMDGASVALWTEGVISSIGKDLKYLSFHPYYDGMPIAYMDMCIDTMTEIIDRVLGPDSGVELMMTEHARYGGGPSDTSGSMINFFAALSTAQFFNRLQARANVAGATFHAIANNQTSIWSIVYRWDGVWHDGVIDKMFHVYGAGMGDRVMEANIDSGGAAFTDVASAECRLTVAANAEGDHTLKLILVNGMENTGVDLDFNFKNTYTLIEETVFTAPNFSSFVYDGASKDIASAVTTAKNESGFRSYHMPAKSLVTLTLETKSRLPQIGEGSGAEAGGAEDLSGAEPGFPDL
ncbi:MAG: hypothetical protein LBH54_03905, partial [Clostridiales bacterium]|nr:hypothetical protein [Clostridiales bacterium]